MAFIAIIVDNVFIVSCITRCIRFCFMVEILEITFQ